MSDGRPTGMLARALEHERALLDGAATDVLETCFGSIVLNTDHLNALSHNFARVDHDVSAADLLSQVDRVLDEVGVAFRVISIEDRNLVNALAPALKEAGFELSSDLYMALVDTPERQPSIDAEIVAFDQARPGIERFWRYGGKSEAGAQRLTDRAITYQQCCEMAYAAVRIDDAFVSRCVLYQRGETAQIDEVTTDPPFEGRGCATAVISAAANYARKQGCDFIFLLTESDDWPQHLYRRLGFRDIGQTYCFVRGED